MREIYIKKHIFHAFDDIDFDRFYKWVLEIKAVVG